MGLNREIGAIRNRANKLGCRCVDVDTSNIPNAYAKWEEDIIRYYYYPKGGVVGCQKKGLQRSYNAILLKDHKMGLSRVGKVSKITGWCDYAYDLLYLIYPKYGVKGCIAKGLNRSSNFINKKAKEKGLSFETDKEVILKRWSDDELFVLQKYYSFGGVKLCQQKGLDRTPKSIQNKAEKLGIKRGV